jgi:predicted PilT family ATPase
VDVGVLGLVEADDAVDDLSRLLRRVGGVEVDERLAVSLRFEDGEILTNRFDV